MFFGKFKNTISDTLEKMLSKYNKAIDFDGYNKYEGKFLNEYLINDRSCFEFLKLMYQTEVGKGVIMYPIHLERIRIVEDFKCLSTFSPFNSPVIMKKLVSNPNERGRQLLDDLRSFRKRYELIYENLEDYIGDYRKTLRQIDEDIVFNIIMYHRTERVEALMKKYNID